MKRTDMIFRRFAGLLLLAIASAFFAGAFVVSEIASAALAETTEDLLTPGTLTALEFPPGGVLEYAFTPTANGEYAVYLFPMDGESSLHAGVELLQDGEVIATGEGTLRLMTHRLTTESNYVLRLLGEGRGYLEIARETLSRSFGMPLELNDGGNYSKLIARSGDVHWYAIQAVRDGAAILTGSPDSAALDLSALLFDSEGHIIARSEMLPSGSFVMSVPFARGQQYLLRISGNGGATGKYLTSVLRSTNSQAPDSIAFPAGSLQIEGRSAVPLSISVAPEDASTLVFLDSSDPGTASIRTDGTIDGRSPGTATITAYAFGGARATCTVTVTNVAVTGLFFDTDTILMREGEELTLNAALQPENASNPRIIYAADNDQIVTVSEDGVIRAVGMGTARVAAISEDGNFTDLVTVTVEQGERHYRALLIGEQNYASTVDSMRPGSINSVNSIASLLGTMEYENGAAWQTQTLLDAPRDSVLATIRSVFSEATERDVSLVYITCHGFYQSGMTFFVMADGSVLSASDLERELRQIPGRIVLMADCCGSGGLLGEAGSTDDILEGVLSAFHGTVGGASVYGSKYIVLASALLDQDSYRISFSPDGDEGGMSTVFARALCDAAGWSIDRAARSSMGADADYDGNITLTELTSYLSRRVSWYLNMAGDYAQTVRAYPAGDPFIIFSGGA